MEICACNNLVPNMRSIDMLINQILIVFMWNDNLSQGNGRAGTFPSACLWFLLLSFLLSREIPPRRGMDFSDLLMSIAFCDIFSWQKLLFVHVFCFQSFVCVVCVFVLLLAFSINGIINGIPLDDEKNSKKDYKRIRTIKASPYTMAFGLLYEIFLYIWK